MRWPSSAAGDCVDLAARVGIGPAEVICIDRLWLCSALVDMRAGAERLPAYDVEVTGAAHANHGDLVANTHAMRMNELHVRKFSARSVAAFRGGRPGVAATPQGSWR